MQGGQGEHKHTLQRTRKWERQGWEVLPVAGEAQAVWVRARQRPGTRLLGETAPQQRRDSLCSHADVAGCGGDTERDIRDVGCGKLISKESEGVSASCLLKSAEGIPVKMLLQRTPPTDNVNPTLGCKPSCCNILKAL